jgi:oxygen-independent coproporphyrinogen III oxidase
MLNAATPRSAYVHIPFCSQRCGYCNFALVAGRDDLMEQFLRALERELAFKLSSPKQVDTLFFGGGTPTHLPAALLDRMLQLVTKWLQPRPDAEVSCEANPLDVTSEKLEMLRNHGVNRLSLGGQSFSEQKLRVLERDHRPEQLRVALERSAGVFDNLSLDLIFAAPGETLDQWKHDLETALALPIRHLSTYGLTIERGAKFYGRMLRNDLHEVDSDSQLAMYEAAIDRLAPNGWEHYEVSSFALPGYRCRHNQTYWLGGPWWAFGPGAASFLPAEPPTGEPPTGEPPTGETCDGIGEPTIGMQVAPPTILRSGWMRREVNHGSTTAYIRKVLAGKSPTAESVRLSPEETLRERLVFGLRRLEGISLSDFGRDWGEPIWPLFEPYLDRYLDAGWLELIDSQQLRLTRHGLMISDSLWPDLLAPAARAS